MSGLCTTDASQRTSPSAPITEVHGAPEEVRDTDNAHHSGAVHISDVVLSIAPPPPTTLTTSAELQFIDSDNFVRKESYPLLPPVRGPERSHSSNSISRGEDDGTARDTTASTACRGSATPRGVLAALKQSLHTFWQRTRRMTARRLLWVLFLVTLVMLGNILQILMLNFWLVSFPEGSGGSYTAFAVPGIFFAAVFVIALAVYVLVRRPNMKFATARYGWQLLVGIGFFDTLNSWMATYAASSTSEVLQALFANLSPLYAVFMAKWMLRDTRRYLNVWIVLVFALTIGGILAASLYGLITTPQVGGRWWILIFFFSIPFKVLMNVLQSLYMIVFTRSAEFDAWCAAAGGGAAEVPPVDVSEDDKRAGDAAVRSVVEACGPVEADVDTPTAPAAAASMVDEGGSVASAGCPTPAMTTRFSEGEDTIVKLMMLAGETVIQTSVTLAFLPADALPWWGQSSSVELTWHNFTSGLRCFFTERNNFLFGFFYTLGFVFAYVGGAYLNHYSVALCSIVSQLSSPLTALLLVLIPSWNVQAGGDSPWYCSLVAIILLSVAALVYVVWEELTDAEKVVAEYHLKKSQLMVEHKGVDDRGDAPRAAAEDEEEGFGQVKEEAQRRM